MTAECCSSEKQDPVEYECFMRKKEVTLNSFSNLVCDPSSLQSLVNPLYIVSFLLFLLGDLACAFWIKHIAILFCWNLSTSKAENSGVCWALPFPSALSLFLSALSFCNANLFMSRSVRSLWWPIIVRRGKCWTVVSGVESSLGSTVSLPLRPHFPPWRRSFYSHYSPFHSVRFFHVFLCSLRMFSLLGIIKPLSLSWLPQWLR